MDNFTPIAGHSGVLSLHFPFVIVLVDVENISFTLSGGRGVAHIVNDACLVRIRDVERQLISQAIPQSQSQAQAQPIDRLVYFSPINNVLCVDGNRVDTMNSKDICFTRCTMQIVARQSNVWGYEDGHGCYKVGMAWDVDRVYVNNVTRNF